MHIQLLYYFYFYTLKLRNSNFHSVSLRLSLMLVYKKFNFLKFFGLNVSAFRSKAIAHFSMR